MLYLFKYLLPKTQEELLQLAAEFKERARFLAGGTDLLADIRLGKCQCEAVIDIKKIPEYNQLSFDGGKKGFLLALVLLALI